MTGSGQPSDGQQEIFHNPLHEPATAGSSGSGPTDAVGGDASPRPQEGAEGADDHRGHLRKMTASLVQILEQLGGSMRPAGGDGAAGEASRAVSRRASATRRVDSVASFPVPADLEKGHCEPSDAGDSKASAAAGGEEMVPAHHVRRLTTTLVDILRHVAAGQPAVGEAQQGGLGGEGDLEDPSEGSGLLGGSSQDDKLSTRSAGTTATEVSGLGATLLANSHTKDEYKGDDVLPFFVDPLAHYGPGLEQGEEDAADGEGGEKPEPEPLPIPHRLKKQRRVNWVGLASFLFFVAALCFYIYIRAAYTLGLGGLLWYGLLMLGVEILGGVAVLPYALCLTMRVVENKAPPPDERTGLNSTKLGYHIRVIIPCYKEPLDVISKTVLAALYASIPAGCKRTVYLLDDGKDAEKKKWMHSLNLHNVVYISGRKRKKGEINGKSANINHAMALIYPSGADIPLTEVICLFDADQCPNADFFLKTVPLLDGGQDVAMVLSPQTFYNLNPEGDIFNHANVHFWDYTQVGYDALGLISCTGTNFLLRSKAFQQAGWFPEWTLTEDFALGIELKKLNWQCRYVDEYLAIGEAPDEVRNCFQQRSRWSKGHFQVFFSKHNPVFSRQLSLLMRWMYGSVILSYFSAFLATPLLMLVPMITVWMGSFPIVINQWAAIAITVYYGATIAVMYYTRALAHLKSMWFASCANSILWFAFLKAMWRATIGKYIAGAITFKVTAKGLQSLKDSALRDVWVSLLFTLAQLVTLVLGLVHWARGNTETPLIISLVYMIYNLVPQYLLLQYAAWRRRPYWNWICKVAMLLSTVCALGGVVLIWVLYPKPYDYQQTLKSVVGFFDTQRVGYLPPTPDVPWRSNAFTQESATPVYLAAQMDNMTLLNSLGLGGSFANPNDPFSGSFGFGGSTFDMGNFSGRRLAQAADPFATLTAPTPAAPAAPAATPSGSGGSRSGGASSGSSAPAAAGTGGDLGVADPFASAGAANPFAAAGEAPSTSGGGSSSSSNPFGGSTPSAGFSSYPFSSGFGDPFSSASAFVPATPVEESWDLLGGWMTGMDGGNIKVTTPIAFTTAVLSWGLMAFPEGFRKAGVMNRTLDSIRWGSDYLAKVHRSLPDTNSSLLITRVGDVATETLLWYRPEESVAARDGYAVGADTGASDLGGSVAAALAAASVVFQSLNESDYARQLLDKSLEVYDFARAKYGSVRDGDMNATLLYNSSTYYDDLAWASGWLYKATKQEEYLGSMYDYYVKHLTEEAHLSDFKYAFDWDNVFWPLNLLMAQETGKGTFKKQTELFLRNWICAGNAANYTTRGRAYNPFSGSTGATANAAFMALVYADQIRAASPTSAYVYQCWGLSQVRYMLGDAGHSLVVGAGRSPPHRTQDRGAACPAPPQVCNRVTGLLSPDPDTHKLAGALVYGTGRSDSFDDVRSADSNRVGVENNAGFAGAVAGVVELPGGLWEQCLQKFGIFRTNPVCGTYLSI